MQLDELQKWFADGVVKLDVAELKDVIVHDAQTSVADRLEIYHHTIIGSLTTALEGTFSATRALVGDVFFRQMAAAYVKGHLPQQANINIYGDDFPVFVKGYVTGHKLPYLADVARFEWLWNEVFLAPDESPLNPETLTAMDENALHKLTFTLLTSAHLFAANYPVDEIHRFAETGGQGEPPEVEQGAVKLLMMRPQTDVLVLRLQPLEYEVIERFATGNNVSQVLDFLTSQPETKFSLEEFLTKCFMLGIFK